MRILTALAAALSCAGCVSGPCAGFETYFPSTKQCSLNPGARFDVVAAVGHVSDYGRSLFDGVPNPQACLTFAGVEKCSRAQSLTYSPSWNETLFAGVDGAALTAGPVGIRFLDTGVFHNVDVCSGSLTIVEDWLRQGGFHLSCTGGSSVGFDLRDVSPGTPLPLDGGAVD